MPVGRRWELLAAVVGASVAAGKPSQLQCRVLQVRQEVRSIGSELHSHAQADWQAVLCCNTDGRVSSRRIFRVGAVFPHASPRTSPPVFMSTARHRRAPPMAASPIGPVVYNGYLNTPHPEHRAWHESL
jgi:hypothetical protein